MPFLPGGANSWWFLAGPLKPHSPGMHRPAGVSRCAPTPSRRGRHPISFRREWGSASFVRSRGKEALTSGLARLGSEANRREVSGQTLVFSPSEEDSAALDRSPVCRGGAHLPRDLLA
ncbi:hypothetical protein VULLAG_LOCUS11499 [Vulpes lagopus]